MNAASLLHIAFEIDQHTDPGPSDTELLRQYATSRDETAFAELVRRNGPVVLRACRHILGEASADDAFQATFLLLSRSAPRLTKPGSLAGWLHAAAVRIAQKARRGENRRRQREKAQSIAPTSPDDLSWREVREVLDAEIAALPESYRVPIILCCVQELSYEAAAHLAGWTVGALRGRLERGKEKLRKRLARHGLSLAAPLLVLGSPPPVSAALCGATLALVQSGMNGKVPAAFAGLLQTGRLRVALLGPVAVALTAIGAILAASSGPIADSPKTDPPKIAKPAESKRPTDFFGDPLPDGAVMRLGTIRSRAGIQSFGFLPDGTVVTVGPNLDVRTWRSTSDLSSEAIFLPLTKQDPYVYPQVSADGRFIAGGTQAKVVVWKRPTSAAKDAKPVAEFDFQHSSKMALSPDGNYLAVTGGRPRAKDNGRIAL